jgi:murein DD-endopeptidase MepM/ murein hydrolase activator NlpD
MNNRLKYKKSTEDPRRCTVFGYNETIKNSRIKLAETINYKIAEQEIHRIAVAVTVKAEQEVATQSLKGKTAVCVTFVAHGFTSVATQLKNACSVVGNALHSLFTSKHLALRCTRYLAPAAFLMVILSSASASSDAAELLLPVETVPLEIIIEHDESVKDGFAIYIDGVFCGAVDDKDIFQSVLDEKVRALLQMPDVISSKFDNAIFYEEESLSVRLFSGSAEKLVEDLLDKNALKLLHTQRETLIEKLRYETTYIQSPLVENVSVTQEGANGEAENTYERKYVNGVLVGETIYNSNVLLAPIPQYISVPIIQPEVFLAPEQALAMADPEAEKWLIWPVNGGQLSSPFGYRESGMHYGIDICSSKGTAIYAAADGVVTYVGNSGNGYGNYIVVDHGSNRKTVYAHQTTNDVVVGQHVKAGDFIGTMGETGNARGVHLHFEVRYDGVAYNGLNYIMSTSGEEEETSVADEEES